MKQLNGQLGCLTPQKILLAIVALFIYTRRLRPQNKLQQNKKMGENHVKNKNKTDEEQKKAEEKRRIERQKEIACELLP